MRTPSEVVTYSTRACTWAIVDTLERPLQQPGRCSQGPARNGDETYGCCRPSSECGNDPLGDQPRAALIIHPSEHADEARDARLQVGVNAVDHLIGRTRERPRGHLLGRQA